MDEKASLVIGHWSLGQSVKFAGTIRWVMFTVVAVAGTGGSGAYWFVTRSDDLLKAELLNQLALFAPDVEFEIERAHFDLSGRVRADRVKLTFPGDDYASLTVGELIITLDRDLLAESQTIQIQRVRLVKPRAWVVRHADQTWNWQRLHVQRNEGRVLPDLEIEHGTVTVQFELPAPQQPLDVNCTELKLTATPSSDLSWAVTASSRVDGTGPVRVDADFHLEGAPWKLSAAVDGLVIDQALIGKIATIRPELKAYIHQAESSWTKLAAGQFPRPNADLRLSRARLPRESDGLMDLGVQLFTDLKFRMASPNEEGEAAPFQVQAEIRNGRLTNRLLPLPLHDVTGKFFADRSQVVLKDLHGLHGESTIACSAKWRTGEQPVVVLKARQIAVDDSLAARLPGPLQRLIRSLSLRGECDFDAQIACTDHGYVPDVKLSLSRGSLNYEKFRYPVRDVSGTLAWHGELAHLECKGLAGLAPVTATGTIKRPGPGAEMSIVLQANDVPIDQTLLQAAPAAVRTSVTALDARGTLDAWVRVIKPAGEGAKITPQIAAKLRDCSVLFDKFPVRIDRITGLVRWDGEMAQFESLHGRHADAQISCHGSYQKEPGLGKLELAFLVEDAPFDSDLLEALPPRLQEGWREFQPTGRWDATAKLSWRPGNNFELSLPKIKLKNAEATLKHFPFPWNNITGELSYEHDELKILSLHAEHDDCRLRANGSGRFPADQPWQVRLSEFFIDDLPTTPALRRALPSELRSVIEALNPTGTISVQGPITFFGPDERRDVVAMKWESDVLFSGTNLTLGQRVENLYGRVSLHGTWDGQQTVIHRGELDLDSLEIFRHQLTEIHGPFRYQQGELVAGSREAVTGPVLQAVKQIGVAEQINAKAIDGVLTFNTVVNFGAEPEYRLRLIMTGGNLERYAQDYLHGQKNIQGNINGWLDLQGRGEDAQSLTGSGYVKVQPAELYEVPVFVQMFQVLGPQFQDRSAFKEAIFLFTVGRQRFNFQSIDLSGNTIRLLGRGFVRFDGIVDLEFFSMLARNQMRIPLVSDVIGMLSRGWVGVKVSGHISDPQVDMRAIPELDDALRQFLGAFDGRALSPPNRFGVPRTGQTGAGDRR